MTPIVASVIKGLMHSTIGTSVAVAGIALVYRHRLDRQGRWLLWWAGVDGVASIANVVGTVEFRNSQYVAQTWYPVSAGLALCVLAYTLAAPRARQLALAAACAVPLVIVGLTIWVEKFGSFARFTGVVHGVTLLLVGAAIVLYRARKARGDMFADPAFLAGAAFVMLGVPSPFLAIGVNFLGKAHRDLHGILYALKAVLTIGAAFLMTAAFHRAAQRHPPGSPASPS